MKDKLCKWNIYLNKKYSRLTDIVEWILSQWWGLLGYCLIAAFFLYLGWDPIDRFIYLTTALIVIMIFNSNRRNSLATHKKLDDLVPPDHEELEKLIDKEIEEVTPYEAD